VRCRNHSTFFADSLKHYIAEPSFESRLYKYGHETFL
jgi:hypothetical protein